jgi:hypothetical protein
LFTLDDALFDLEVAIQDRNIEQKFQVALLHLASLPANILAFLQARTAER